MLGARGFLFPALFLMSGRVPADVGPPARSRKFGPKGSREVWLFPVPEIPEFVVLWSATNGALRDGGVSKSEDI